jgi:hypothetical protein
MSSMKGQQFRGKHFAAAPLGKLLKSMGEKNTSSDAGRPERKNTVGDSDFPIAAPLEHPFVITYISSCQQGNRMIYASPQTASLGFGPEAWLGETDLRLKQVHEDDADRLAEAIKHSRITGEKFNCHYRLYDSNRKTRWYHDEAAVVCDESGAPLFIRGAMLDITDKKEMEAELNQHRYRLERHVESRTGQLMKRVSLLESCNEALSEKLAMARMELTALKQQPEYKVAKPSGCPEKQHDLSQQAHKIINSTRDNWIAHGCYKPAIKKSSPDAQSAQEIRPAQIKNPPKIDDSAVDQLDGISDWARNMIGWRVAAAGAIA